MKDKLVPIGAIASGAVLLSAAWSGWQQQRWINHQNFQIAQAYAQQPKQHSNPLWALMGIGGLGAIAYGALALKYGEKEQPTSAPVPRSEPATKLVPMHPKTSPPANNWIQKISEYPCLLVYGPQGSGKTTITAEIVRQKIKYGHTVQVLDPHRKAGHWQGLECFGDGMDYLALSQKIKWFSGEVVNRYKQYSTDPNFNPQKLTIVCDEFTNWAKRCDGADEFFASALSDIRKININVIFIAHARTMTALGDAKGLADARDSALCELELNAEICPKTGKSKPTFEGLLKLPGTPQNKRSPIRIDPIHPDFDFRSLNDPEYSDPSNTEWLNSILNKGHSGLNTPEHSVLNDPLDPSEPSSESKGRLVQLIRSGVPKQRAITSVWFCTPGGSKAYKTAESFYEEIKQKLGV